jgi:hypothetical protein
MIAGFQKECREIGRRSDIKKLTKKRNRLQIEHAHSKSRRAKIF